MKAPKISIIIPVYNVSKYIDKCIESVLNQTYSDFELILVDDGSIDDSGIICDKYELIDHRVQVCHKKNEGVSVARNIGISMSQGKWVTFIDGDDFVAETYLAGLVKPIIKNSDIEFVHGGCTNYFVDTDSFHPEQVYTDVVSENKQHILDEFRGLVVSKLFLREIIAENNLYFNPAISIGEDMIFTMQYLSLVKKYAFVSENGYYYRRHNTSATRRTSYDYRQKLEYYRTFLSEYQNYINQNKTAISVKRETQAARLLFDAIYAMYHQGISRSVRLDILKKDIGKVDYSIINRAELTVGKAFFLRELYKGLYSTTDILLCFCVIISKLIK